MSDEVLISIISVVGGVLSVVLTVLLAKINKVGKDAAASREQTQNSHTDLNLRDDIDGKHRETHQVLGLVLEQIKGLQTSDRNQWAAIEALRRKRFR